MMFVHTHTHLGIELRNVFESFQAIFGGTRSSRDSFALLCFPAFNFLCARKFQLYFQFRLQLKLIVCILCHAHHMQYMPRYIHIQQRAQPRPPSSYSCKPNPSRICCRLPCAILIYLSKFVKKLYEFYLWPAHDRLMPRPPLPPLSVCTTSVSISCYRLFPPNLHTQNNLTVQRRHLPFASPPPSLWDSSSCVPTGSTRPINFHLVSQLELPVLALALSLSFCLPL